MKNVMRTIRCDAKMPARYGATGQYASNARSANQSRARKEAVTESKAFTTRPLPCGRGSDKTCGGFFAPAFGCGVTRHRGSALILVVAVLGILFVAGAALLNQVTFSTSTLEAARQARQDDSAVDAIEQIPLDFLGRAFIGPDGQAINPQSRYIVHVNGDPNTPCTMPGQDCVLAMPPVVETAGVVPWIDEVEPMSDDPLFPGDLQYKLTSNLVMAAQGKPGVDPNILTGMAKVGCGSPIFGRFDADYSLVDPAFELPRDSDGDGVVDTFQFPLPAGVLPRDIQRDLSDRLRDPGYQGSNPNSTRDPDQLWVSLRIVPHGGMVNLNDARDSMVNFLFDPSNIAFSRPSNRYSPQTNEWYLRHRGPMLPRSLPQSLLLSSNTSEGYGTYLLPPHEQPFGGGAVAASMISDPTLRQWWGYDFMTDGSAGSPWSRMMDSTRGEYDFVHAVTTISHDDHLRRPGRYPNPTGGRDWISAMRVSDGDPAGLKKYADASMPNPQFALDNYPLRLDGSGDRRLGRLKVAIPELDELLKAGGTSVLLRDLSLPINQVVKDRIVGTTQESFLLMLLNVDDMNRDGNPNQPDDAIERAVIAAMLTANLIDFADLDPAGDSTRVDVVDIAIDNTGATPPAIVPVMGSDGTTPLAVYGFERQPFITEVYANFVPSAMPNEADTTQSSFAIELYNPYPFPLPLAGYALREIDPPTIVFAAGITRDQLDEDLSGETIPANGFLTVFSLADPVAAGMTVDSSDDWAVDEDSVIGLYRTLTNGPEILVDIFNVDVDTIAAGATAIPDAGGMDVRSWERDNSEWAPNNSRWRFVVPRVGEIPSNTPGNHTLGAINTHVDPEIYAVHVDVANQVRFEQAFPTTGSMLLMSRMAHVHDGSPPGSTNWTAPFNRVNTTMGPPLLSRTIVTDFDKPENGRIPVFDFKVDTAAALPLPAHRDVTLNGMPLHGEPGVVEGINALPWGQLIFDYFTALPLENCDPSNFTCDVDKLWPRVDQSGLRVHGRININAAPSVVIGSTPMFPASKFPTGFQSDLASVLPTSTSDPKIDDIGNGNLANAITWYRDGIKADNTMDYESARDPFNTAALGASAPYVPRQGYGFLSVGELFNVSMGTSVQSSFRMDAGANGLFATNQQGVYDRAVGRMVAMGDWLTTRSHVFTVYGVIRGQFNDDPDPVELEKSLRATDQRAIRFQTTVDRLPMFFGRSKPERIGARVQGGYADVRAD